MVFSDTNNLPNNVYREIKNEMQELLATKKGSFNSYLNKLSQLRLLCIEDGNIKKTINKIGLNYLSKGAKYPLSVSGEYALPLLDYYQSKEQTYFRSTGNGLSKIYRDILIGKGFGFLIENGDIAHTFVKSQKFKHILKGHFLLDKITSKEDVKFNKRILLLDDKVRRMTNRLVDETIYLDISSILSKKNKLVNAKKLQERIGLVREKLKNAGVENVIPIAVVKLDEGQYSCIIIDPKNKQQQQRNLEHLSSFGYRPDIMGVKETLLREGLDTSTIADILTLHTCEQNFEKDSLVDYKTIIKQLKTLEKSKSKLNVYYKFISHFLTEISEKASFLNDDIENDKKIKLLVLDSIQKILKEHENFPDMSFEKELSGIDLIFEELAILLLFMPDQNLELLFEQVASVGILEAKCHAFTSSTNAFYQAFYALYKNKGEKLNVLFSDSSYFELKSIFPDCKNLMKSSFSSFEDALNTSDYDAICFDLYPNDATQKSVGSVDIQSVLPLTEVLQRSEPLTIIIDTTTTVFFDPEVKKLVNYYEEAIKKGNLNIVLVNSLQKFAMCGIDKYTGGATTVYNNQNFDGFNHYLSKYALAEPLSREARNFFALFFKTGEECLEYIDLINRNTETFYQKLNFMKEEKSLLVLADKNHSKIPMIGIHFSNFLEALGTEYNKNENKEIITAIFREYYLLAGRDAGLYISKRSSFGFAHANINDAYTALRMSIGLEDESQIDQYVTLWKKFESELDHFIQKPLLVEKLKEVLDGSQFQSKWSSTLEKIDREKITFESFIEQIHEATCTKI